MEERYLFGLAAVAAGVFSITCAYKEYGWFMNHRKAKFMCKVLGRKGARIFYMVLGSAIALGGVLVLLVGLPPRP